MLYFYGKLPKNCPGGSTLNRPAEPAQNRTQSPAEPSASAPSPKAANIRPRTVAIVGTRKPTEYGRKVAYDLAFAAAQAGAVVVSGLAYGIDSIAHRAALDAGGVTVAVLGTPISEIYPRPHLALAAEIVKKGGAILSELPPDAEKDIDYFPKSCFLARNRLISGLADIVVIPEAAERSGSLNTAAHALDQGREVLAVPGDIRRPMSRGCNALIARSSAGACLGPEMLVELLFPERAAEIRRAQSRRKAQSHQRTAQQEHTKAQNPLNSSPAEAAILSALAAGPADGEDLLARSALSPAEFSQALTLLEIKNQIKSLGLNLWALK